MAAGAHSGGQRRALRRAAGGYLGISVGRRQHMPGRSDWEEKPQVGENVTRKSCQRNHRLPGAGTWGKLRVLLQGDLNGIVPISLVSNHHFAQQWSYVYERGGRVVGTGTVDTQCSLSLSPSHDILPMTHLQKRHPSLWTHPKARVLSLHKKAECPPLVSDVLLSHGLTPQYHRRSGA